MNDEDYISECLKSLKTMNISFDNMSEGQCEPEFTFYLDVADKITELITFMSAKPAKYSICCYDCLFATKDKDRGLCGSCNEHMYFVPQNEECAKLLEIEIAFNRMKKLNPNITLEDVKKRFGNVKNNP